MPNRPIDFKFTADVVRLLNGLDKAELSVEDLEQAFVEASNSSEDLEKKINRATRDAEKDVEKLERAIRDLPKATEKAADDGARDFDRLGDDAKDAGQEVGQEFKQNLGQSLASGGGVGDLISETLGGLVAGLKGPVGLAAAALAGVAALAFQNVQKQAEEMAALTDSWLATFRDNLGKSMEELDRATLESQYQDWVKDNIDFLQDQKDLLGDTGITVEEYGRALYEGGGKLDELQSKLRGIQDVHGTIVTQGDRIRVKYDDAGRAAGDLLTTLGPLAQVQGDAADEAATFAAATGTSHTNTVKLRQDIEKLPKKIQIGLEYYLTSGSLDPNSANYSPGHVAIVNAYTSKSSGSSG